MKFFSLFLFVYLLSVPTWAQDLKNIVFLGDSLTEGYGIEKKQAYPQLIEDLLLKENIKVKSINAGISGSTSASCNSRIKWILKSKPDLVVLSLGANDALRALSVKETQKNLDSCIQSLLEVSSKKINILLTGMYAPPNYGKAYTQSFKQMYRELKNKHSLEFVEFLLEGVAGEKTLNLADGIHPNEKGHIKIANHILPSIRKLLK